MYSLNNFHCDVTIYLQKKKLLFYYFSCYKTIYKGPRNSKVTRLMSDRLNNN